MRGCWRPSASTDAYQQRERESENAHAGVHRRTCAARGALRPWGVRMAISVDFGSPQTVGGLDTFDPLDARVIAWWKAKVDELYAACRIWVGS